ncbi:hypothetical protein BsWGS_14051 [Bradybaena similaris]
MSSPHKIHPVQTQPEGYTGGQPGPYNGNPYGGGPQAGGHTNNTTVITQQPAAAGDLRDWSSGLYDCCDDMGICLCGAFCGLCLSLKISSHLEPSMRLQFCMPLRTRLRNQERIQGSVCNDWLISMFCQACANCQMAREVKMIKQRGR